MAADYTITGQRQTTALSSGGSFQDVMEVSFQTTTGVSGKINVPLSQYSAEHVKGLIEARVERINAVNKL